MTAEELQELQETALRVREHVIRLSSRGGCFIGASLSCADLLVYLYRKFLKINGGNLGDPGRDYFLLSKGHDVPALYGTFIELGWLPPARLDNHLQTDDSIYWHPNRAVPGVEFHSGSLGHLLPVAAGIALDCRRRGAENKVVVMVGDGELDEGSNWESLLTAGACCLDNLLIIVDRNGFQANMKTEELIPLERLAAKFEAFGCAAREIDGHSFPAIAAALAEFPFAPGKPSVVIARTVRGKGLPSIEARADRWFVRFTAEEVDGLLRELHGQAGAILNSESLDGEMTAMNYEELLTGLLGEDDRFFVLTAENRSPMRNLPARFPANFLDVGIAEQSMIGMAAGLALRGRIPVVHALAAFLTMRPFEFIRTDAGLGNLPVKLVGTLAGFLSEANGPTHQALEDVALMRGIPNLNVFCPADEADLLAGLPQVFRADSPFYIRYNNLPPLVEHATFTPGRAEVFGDGRAVAIISYGFMFNQALAAKKALEERGVPARLINLRMLKPLDEETIVEAARTCRFLATVEDHFETGGLYTILAEVLLRRGLTARVIPFALRDRWFHPAPLEKVLKHEGFTGPQLAQSILAAINQQRLE